MRSRMLGGLAIAALIAASVTLGAVHRVRAAEAPKEVIRVSAPIALPPVVVSQVEQLVATAIPIAHAVGSIDLIVCVAAERSSDSLAVSDSLLSRLRVVVPRRYESSVAPTSARPPNRSDAVRPTILARAVRT